MSWLISGNEDLFVHLEAGDDHLAWGDNIHVLNNIRFSALHFLFVAVFTVYSETKNCIIFHVDILGCEDI